MRPANTFMLHTNCWCIVFVMVYGESSFAHDDRSIPHWQQATQWPDRVVTNFGSDPSTSLSMTWRTDASVQKTMAQFVRATADTRFDLKATMLEAITNSINIERISTPQGTSNRNHNPGLGSVHYHHVTINHLQPGTAYLFRVRGAEHCWSEWFQTRTAPQSGAVSFVYLGDAQNGIRSHWSRVIRAAHQVAPNADFFLHAGDLVNQGDRDQEWAEWFDAGSYLHARIPSVPVVGNHEYIPVVDSQTQKKTRLLTPLWRAQFTLPIDRELPEELHEAVYDLRFPCGLHLFLMNSAPSDFHVQAKWLDRKLTESDSKWRVVSMHHPYFIPLHSNRHADNLARIQAFTGVINKHKVDLVIVGHIHTYMRSRKNSNANAPARVLKGEATDVETMFVISSSGAKMTQLPPMQNQGKESDQFSIDRSAANTPMFQVIRIENNKLVFTAHTALGTVYDHFTITKQGQKKSLINGTEAYGDVRTFENTGPYQDWQNLK